MLRAVYKSSFAPITRIAAKDAEKNGFRRARVETVKRPSRGPETVEEPEVVIEVTITWWHLLALAALAAAAALAASHYPQLRLAVARDLLRAPLAEVKLGAEAYRPGSLVRVEVCPAAELGSGDLTVLIVDPEGRVVRAAALRAEGAARRWRCC